VADRPTLVTSKPYLPSRERLDSYLDRAYDTAWLTNRGPLLRELEERLCEYLEVPRLLLVGNGTLALQVAYRVLGIKAAAITTPFSYVATTSSLAWERIRPVFADIDVETLNLDPASAAAAARGEVDGMVPVHVFGNPCDPALDGIAGRRHLPLVFDAAHAFGVSQGGRSVLLRGDASVLSLHATKLFHTVEGGAIAFTDPAAHDEAAAMISFGIQGEDSVGPVGINAKMNEFEAAMGLAVLDEIDEIVAGRARVAARYDGVLGDAVARPVRAEGATDNNAYYPVLFADEAETVAVRDALAAVGAMARRYFRPSLDTLDYVESPPMPNSRWAADVTLCLPLYPALSDVEADLVAGTVVKTLEATRR
jgi:dTDP-4-amino-4,6-dideoxygalactose transaminase